MFFGFQTFRLSNKVKEKENHVLSLNAAVSVSPPSKYFMISEMDLFPFPIFTNSITCRAGYIYEHFDLCKSI